LERGVIAGRIILKSGVGVQRGVGVPCGVGVPSGVGIPCGVGVPRGVGVPWPIHRIGTSGGYIDGNKFSTFMEFGDLVTSF
jgi:hypothetical protein